MTESDLSHVGYEMIFNHFMIHKYVEVQAIEVINIHYITVACRPVYQQLI